MKQPQSNLVFITPKMAHELLSKNTQNRKIKEVQVKRLAQSIINDKFVTTNNGIGIDINGVLTDGQHRLLAIIKANKGAWIFVMTDLQPVARIVCDTGGVRTPSNALQMLNIGKYTIHIDGVEKLKDCTKLLSSVSAYMMLHQTNQFNKVQGFGHIITNDEIVEFVKANHDELKTSVVTTLELTGECPYVQDTHMFFIYQMHKFFNEGRIRQFIRIVTGKEISKNADTCPATKLMRALQENHGKRNGTRYNTKDLLGLTIDASNKFMHNIEMKPKAKLVARPNNSNLETVKFISELTPQAILFFSAIKLNNADDEELETA